jgi:hypothetical protein
MIKFISCSDGEATPCDLRFYTTKDLAIHISRNHGVVNTISKETRA